MMSNQTGSILHEMERLRKELYGTANENVQTLTSKEIYKASTNLDKVIVKYLQQKYSNNYNNNYSNN